MRGFCFDSSAPPSDLAKRFAASQAQLANDEDTDDAHCCAWKEEEEEYCVMASKRSASCCDNNDPPIEKKSRQAIMKIDEFTYTWIIKNVAFREKKPSEPLRSPVFSFSPESELAWFVRMYPNGLAGLPADCIPIFLVAESEAAFNVAVTFKLSFLSTAGDSSSAADGINISIAKRNAVFSSSESRRWASRCVFTTAEKLKQLLANQDLTVLCRINILDRVNKAPGGCRGVTDDTELPSESLPFSDVILNVRGKEFRAHRAILAACSSYFSQKLREHDASSPPQNWFDIDDIDIEVFAEMLRYIYTGKAANLDKVARDLIVAADTYALEGLKNLCAIELRSSLCIENAADYLMIAERHKAAELQEETIRFIVEHSEDIIDTDGYKTMVEQKPRLIDKLFRASVATRPDNVGSASGTTYAEKYEFGFYSGNKKSQFETR